MLEWNWKVYFFTVFIIFCVRFFYLVYMTFTNKRQTCERTLKEPVKTLIVIGSGGHTAEMLKMIMNIDHNKYRPRIYCMASNDITSEMKIISHEYAIDGNKDEFSIMKIPRCRNVGQSYVSSIFTTLYSIFVSIPKMLMVRPELILCNGPGTCIPLCLIAFLMRVFFISNNKIVFIESICRVRTISLTGHILLLFADVVYVHWPALKVDYPRVQFLGNIF